MDKKTTYGVGVCGCGKISGIYLTNMIHRFPNLNVVSCCAAHYEHAEAKAAEFGIEAVTYEEMLRDDRIDMVVILTPAPTHYDLIRQALEAGKHVYTEKSITLDTASAKELRTLADKKGLYLSSAPDTFLGEAFQTALRAVNEGKIGQITGFSVNANRCFDILTSIFKFLNLPGGGIDLDYGVYYMTQLVSLLGPMESVFAMEQNPKPVRVNSVPGEKDYGEEFASPNITELAAVLRTKGGIQGTLLLDGESLMMDLAHVYIYGTKGVLTLCDANGFGGTVTVTTDNMKTWSVQDETLDYGLPYADNSRGIGPSEMAEAIEAGRKSRTDCSMAIHVLDIFESMARSAASGKLERVDSSCDRPEVL